METSSILSPVMLWRDFKIKYPLRETKTSEEIFDNVIYSEVYFSGRETEEGRVRIFGIYAKSRVVKKSVKTAAILILPDASETVDLELINYYVRQGYSVLMVDYRGKTDKTENYTQYPSCISFANYLERGERMDRCPDTARETCWFEWVSVAKYALEFLKSRRDIDFIGVLGIKSGADVGWQLCTTEDSGINCFVPLFCAGGRAFDGFGKNSEEDMPMNDERVRFLAGVDASAYTQYMRCPTFYMTASNALCSDVERAFDSLSRVPKDTPLFFNIAPRFSDVLDGRCQKNIDLFFAKYLLGFKADVPSEPKMSVVVSGRKVDIVLEETDHAENKVKKAAVYVAEGEDDPAFRCWTELKHVSEDEGEQRFSHLINSTCSYISLFAVVTYKNGFTVSTKIITRKFPKIRFPKRNLLYSGKMPLTVASASPLKEEAENGLYFTGDYPLSTSVCAGEITGIKPKFGLVFYRFSSEIYKLNEYAFLKADLFSSDRCSVKVTLVTEHRGEIKEFFATAIIRQENVWNDVLIRFSDFKSDTNKSIEDYSSVKAIKFDSEFSFVLNNVLVL